MWLTKRWTRVTQTGRAFEVILLDLGFPFSLILPQSAFFIPVN